jgi:hypothetical protein
MTVMMNQRGEPIFCSGDAQPDDEHLRATVHCVDEQVIEWLERRMSKKRSNGSGDMISAAFVTVGGGHRSSVHGCALPRMPETREVTVVADEALPGHG